MARIQQQAANLVFPMGRLFGHGGFASWLHDVLRRRGGSAEEVLDLQKRLADLRQRRLKPVEDYDCPMVTLAEETPGAAVCTIFETLNRTGMKLGVFDLLTARFWPKSVNLRALWEKARADNPILDEFAIDPYYVLQIVNLLEPGTDKDGRPKAASIKRGEILAQSAVQADAGWARAVAGLSAVLRILREDCGGAVLRWLPYNTMVIPAAAAWASQTGVPTRPRFGANRGKLVRWFWCASLVQRYENARTLRRRRTSLSCVARWSTPIPHHRSRSGRSASRRARYGLAIPDKYVPIDAALPLPMEPGSVLLTDQRTIHSSLDNVTEGTCESASTCATSRRDCRSAVRCSRVRDSSLPVGPILRQSSMTRGAGHGSGSTYAIG